MWNHQGTVPSKKNRRELCRLRLIWNPSAANMSRRAHHVIGDISRGSFSLSFPFFLSVDETINDNNHPKYIHSDEFRYVVAQVDFIISL